MNGKQGFTLIELLVVVLIIGILSSIALPQYTKAVQKARGTEAMIAGRTLANAENIYYMGEKLYTRDLTALDIEMPELKYFELGSKNLDKVIDTYTSVGNEPVATFALYSKKRRRGSHLYVKKRKSQQYFLCRCGLPRLFCLQEREFNRMHFGIAEDRFGVKYKSPRFRPGAFCDG